MAVQALCVQVCQQSSAHTFLTSLHHFIVIYFSEECVTGSIRLVDGPSKLVGRVEVCYSGVWAPLYAQGWNDFSARVLCKQLGYDGMSTIERDHYMYVFSHAFTA